MDIVGGCFVDFKVHLQKSQKYMFLVLPGKKLKIYKVNKKLKYTKCLSFVYRVTKN